MKDEPRSPTLVESLDKCAKLQAACGYPISAKLLADARERIITLEWALRAVRGLCVEAHIVGSLDVDRDELVAIVNGSIGDE